MTSRWVNSRPNTEKWRCAGRQRRDVAAPSLADLRAATRATVHLAVRDGDAALYLDRVSGVASVPVVSRMGTRPPLHATGVGKVLPTHAPPEVRERVLARLAAVTPYTVTSRRALAGQLARVARDGYATTTEAMTPGASSVAVPVRVGGEVVAAVGVVVADLRHHRARLLSGLQVAAAGVGRGLSRPAS